MVTDSDHDYYYDYYEAYGGPINITEQRCLGWCEWKKTTLNWTMFTACEWWDGCSSGCSLPSLCMFYGDNELVISEGDGTNNTFCYAYGDAGTLLYYRMFCLFYSINSHFSIITLTT